jgi:hypothetical protein
MSGPYAYFELHRASDDLVYQFDRITSTSGETAYRRRDADLCITYRPTLGWVAYDEETQSLTGRCWDILPEAQDTDHPPVGIWVSRKGAKSYVYELIYSESPPPSQA